MLLCHPPVVAVFGCSVYGKLRIKYKHSPNQVNTTENSTSHNKIKSPSQDTTALHPNVFSSEIHQLLVINTCLILSIRHTAEIEVVLLSNQHYHSGVGPEWLR
jgi:ABC-type uncharacterized transport system involved in gliding motility auxiliary subunit